MSETKTHLPGFVVWYQENCIVQSLPSGIMVNFPDGKVFIAGAQVTRGKYSGVTEIRDPLSPVEFTMLMKMIKDAN